VYIYIYFTSIQKTHEKYRYFNLFGGKENDTLLVETGIGKGKGLLFGGNV
jgi:hypothetical protein